LQTSTSSMKFDLAGAQERARSATVADLSARQVCYRSRPLRSPGLLRLLTSTTSALRSIAACCALHDQPAAAPARYYICASSARASLWPWRVAFAAGYSSEAVTAPTGPSLHTAPCARTVRAPLASRKGESRRQVLLAFQHVSAPCHLSLLCLCAAAAARQ